MGEINIKYNWYVRIVIIILSLYMVFITLMCLNHKKKSEQEITLRGPAHNYEVPTKTHVITEMDGDREINWYSEDESKSK
jgi:hypothetical protein